MGTNDSALSVLQNAKYIAHSQSGGYILEARVLDKIGIYYSKKCPFSSFESINSKKDVLQEEEQQQQQQQELNNNNEHHQYYNKYSHLALTSFKDAITLRNLDYDEKQQKIKEDDVVVVVDDNNDEKKKKKHKKKQQQQQQQNKKRQQKEQQQQYMENAFSLNEIGNIHYKECQYDKAMKCYKEALNIHKSHLKTNYD